MNYKIEKINETTYDKKKLAEIFYECAFFRFVEKSETFDYDTDKINFHYDFKKIKDNYSWIYDNYYLIYNENSFVCFSTDDENQKTGEKQIAIWTCWTDKNKRKKGSMTKLLTQLKSLYNEKISIDTNNTDLVKICKKLDFSFFRVEINDSDFFIYDYLKSDILDYNDFLKEK